MISEHTYILINTILLIPLWIEYIHFNIWMDNDNFEALLFGFLWLLFSVLVYMAGLPILIFCLFILVLIKISNLVKKFLGKE